MGPIPAFFHHGGFIATAMDFAVMVELKMLGRDVDETKPISSTVDYFR
jgi:acyl-coenzyme A thioesterase PaaI-like protein